MAQIAAPRTTAIDQRLAAITSSTQAAHSFGYIYTNTERAAAASAATVGVFVPPGSADRAVLQRALAAIKRPPAAPSGKV